MIGNLSQIIDSRESARCGDRGTSREDDAGIGALKYYQLIV